MTRATREHIIKTAIDVFLQQGLLNVSFNTLIRETGISKGGVYHHFASRDELIVAVLEHFINSFTLENTIPTVSLSAWQKLQLWFNYSIEKSQELKKYNKLFVELFFYSTCSKLIKQKINDKYYRFYSQIVQLLEQAKQDADIKEQTKSHLVATIILGINDGIDAAISVLDSDYIEARKAKIYSIELLFASIVTKQGQKNWSPQKTSCKQPIED